MKQDPRLSRTPLIDASVFVCLTPVKWMRLGKKTGSEFLTPKKVLLHQVRMSFFPSRDRCVKSEFYCALSTCTIKRPSESTHASDVYPTMTTTRGRFEFFSFVRERERVNWAGSDRAMNDRFSFIRDTLLFFCFSRPKNTPKADRSARLARRTCFNEARALSTTPPRREQVLARSFSTR